MNRLTNRKPQTVARLTTHLPTPNPASPRACLPRPRAIAALAALSLALQGCASPGREVKQTVRVETPGCSPAACDLSNDRGSWHLPRTPGAVTLITSSAELRLICLADDGAKSSYGAQSSLPPVTSGGGVAGGLVGGVGIGTALGAAALTFIPVLGVIVVLTGVAVGAATGTAVESGLRPVQYPDLISVPMNCATASAALPAHADGLGLAVQPLSPVQAHDAGLGECSAVLVTNVAEGSPAAAAGLRSGDIILAAAGLDLGIASDLVERVNGLANGGSLDLRVWREGKALDVALTSPVAAP